MAGTDDDIIRKRLLIEGDGGSDDKRITSLLKTFIRWANSNDPEDDNNLVYQRMLSQLASCEGAMEKAVMVYQMNREEQTNYQTLSQEIEQSISDAHEKITECKTELQKARMIRRNRQQYDTIAAQIQKLPDRQETLKQLESLDKELTEMQDTKMTLQQKLQLRKKQFHMLITAIHEMQRILEVDEKTESEDTGQNENGEMDVS